MYKILVIGYSGLVRRRILDTLNKNKIPYDIASRSKMPKDSNAKNWYIGYNQGIKKSNANVAYISLPNSLHFTWAKKTLKKGFHTIIDKPATINLKQLQRLFKIAKQKKILLTEAIFFNYHKQTKKILNEIKKDKLININTNFSIPLPKKNSIHLSKKLGGGVILDMGPYIAAVARLFFEDYPKKKIKKIVFKNNISSKIYVKFIYKNSIFIGKFSHNDKYKNFIEIIFKKKIITLSRFFSPPADIKLEFKIIRKNRVTSKFISDDVIKNYIKEVFKKIKKKEFSYYKKNMIFDAKIRTYLQEIKK